MGSTCLLYSPYLSLYSCLIFWDLEELAGSVASQLFLFYLVCIVMCFTLSCRCEELELVVLCPLLSVCCINCLHSS